MFQPFLRFWPKSSPTHQSTKSLIIVSTLLEILDLCYNGYSVTKYRRFQPFLRFWNVDKSKMHISHVHEFQPFLRFWGLCVWLLWVFKFFFGFL